MNEHTFKDEFLFYTFDFKGSKYDPSRPSLKASKKTGTAPEKAKTEPTPTAEVSHIQPVSCMGIECLW